MKTLTCLPMVVCTTALQMLAATPETSKHFVKFTDPVSGAVSYLLKPGEYGWNQQSIYFTAKSMTDDGRFLLFHVAADERDKKVNHRKTLWAFDFERDDAFPLPSAIGGRTPFLDIRTGEVYWIDDKGVHRVDLRASFTNETLLCQIPPELVSKRKGKSTRYCTHLTLTKDRSKAFLDAEIDGRRYEQGMLDLKTGKWEKWTDAQFCCNHGQVNPENDRLALVAWEYGSSLTLDELDRPLAPGEKLKCPPFVTDVKRPEDWVYPRLWLCEPGRMTMVPPGLFNYATHENFTADGKGFYYCAKGVVLCDLATRRQYRVDPITTQHATMTADLRYVTGDCSRDGWWRGCAWTCMFWNRETHRGMYIFSKRPRLNAREKESKMHPDPHPHFVCKDRYIVSTMIGDDPRMNLCVTPVAPLVAATSDPSTAAPVVRIPLEWSIRNALDVPYELEIDNRRLVELDVVAKPFTGNSIVPPTAFAIEATVGGKSVRVPLEAIKGRDGGRDVLLRFTPPVGTTALALLGDVMEKFEVCDNAGCDNLLAGMLDEANLGRWKADDKVEVNISRVRDGILLDGGKRNDNPFRPGGVECVMPLPEGVAGKPVAFEMDVRSLVKETWPNDIRIRQLDAQGEELPESVVDPRWLSHMRPPQKTCFFRERGRLHPAARALKIRFGLRWNDPGVGADGLPAPLERFRPKLLISHVAMRVARALPFPALDDRNFSPGVSGAPGDAALNIGTNGVFSFQTRSQAAWAEAIPLRRESDCFFPFRAGTIEAWFRPRIENLRNAYTLFSAAHANGRTETSPAWGATRGELVRLAYHAGTRTLSIMLKDRGDKAFSAEGKAEIADGEWTHVALAFEPGAEARAYINGRLALRCPLAGFVPHDPENAKYPNTDGPVELYAGSAYRTIPDAKGPRETQPSPALAGALDLLRVSTGARYREDFAPARAFAIDVDTRALFCFDRSFDGVSGGGIGAVPGTFWSSEPRRRRTIEANGKTFQYYPEKVGPANDPYATFLDLNYPVVPAAADFRRAYAPRAFVADAKPGCTLAVEAPKGVVTDSIEIRNTGRVPLAYPALVNAGDVDARSFADIAESIPRLGRNDKALANALFNFMLKSSDYFMHHVPTYSPGSDVPRSVEYEALTMLNAYCGFECGPLNNLTANAFANSGHIPAVRTGGYGHEFEEVFFDAQNHIYDLAAHKFFPAYDNITVAGLREVDDEPGIITRYGGRPAAFARRSHRFHIVQSPSFRPKVGPVLNPGERFVAHFANDGHVNDLQINPMFTGCRRTIDRKLKPYKWDYAAQTHSKPRKGDELCRVERYFPDYCNAFVVFDGKPEKGNPAFVHIKSDSFAYEVKSAYPIVWCDYRATRADGSAVALELSTDNGKTWRPLAAPADYPVMGRVAYLVRVNAPLADIANFRAVTETQFNPRVFPGRLKGGANKLAFKAVTGETARVTVRYRVPAKDISVVGAASSGAIVGFESRLLAFDPTAPASFAVKGVGPSAKVRVCGPVAAQLSDGRLTLSAVAAARYPAFAAVTLADGEAEQELKVLIAPSVRLAAPGRPFFLKTAADQARFSFPALPAGKYVMFQLERFAAQKPNTWAHNLLVKVPGKTVPQPAGSIWNPGIDFYGCAMGRPGGGRRGNWKWDFPNEPESQYPYTLLREWDLPEGTDSLVYSMWGKNVPDGGVELAACLILPAPDAAFRAQLIKQLSGFRTKVALDTATDFRCRQMVARP